MVVSFAAAFKSIIDHMQLSEANITECVLLLADSVACG